MASQRLWVTLPSSWSVQDVQAGLSVVMSFLSTGSVFVLVRQFWVVAARRVLKEGRAIPAYALFSINTIGEAIDVVWLLRSHIFSPRYYSFLIQCTLVVFLTIFALFNGLLARIPTRVIEVHESRSVEVIPPNRMDTNTTLDLLDTETVFHILSSNDVPNDTLLDFWPLTNTWAYNKAQWKSSWVMRCESEDSVPIPYANISDDTCSFVGDMWRVFPAISEPWHEYVSTVGDIPGDLYAAFEKSQQYHADEVDHVYIFVRRREPLEQEIVGSGNDSCRYTSRIRMQTVAYNLSGVPASTAFGCDFVPGPIKHAEYSVSTCDLERNVSQGAFSDLCRFGAYAEGLSAFRLVTAYAQYYGSRMQASETGKLPGITAAGLIKLYQTYLILRGLSSAGISNSFATQPKTTRDLTQLVSAVQVSTVCIVIYSIVAVMVLAGLVSYWFFFFSSLSKLERTPQSKLDWMLQSLYNDGDCTSHSCVHSGFCARSPGELSDGSVPEESRCMFRNSVVDSLRSRLMTTKLKLQSAAREFAQRTSSLDDASSDVDKEVSLQLQEKGRTLKASFDLGRESYEQLQKAVRSRAGLPALLYKDLNSLKGEGNSATGCTTYCAASHNVRLRPPEPE